MSDIVETKNYDNFSLYERFVLIVNAKDIKQARRIAQHDIILNEAIDYFITISLYEKES